ncbi:MAG TPA: hypothetical protein VMV77_03455 [Bacteroidales bacterium]|nr:hypothetical protein [Bacteroidales bacterium]
MKKETSLEQRTRLLAGIRGQRHNIMGLELEEEVKVPSLFFFTVYTLVEHDAFSTLDEDSAISKLADLTSDEMEVYFCKSPGNIEGPPPSMKGRKKLHIETINDHRALSDLIFQMTGIRIIEADLMKSQNQAFKAMGGESGAHKKIRILAEIRLGELTRKMDISIAGPRIDLAKVRKSQEEKYKSK